MPRKKKVIQQVAPEKVVSENPSPVRVRCIADDCWAGGGYLSPGDETILAPEAVKRLLKEDKIELV